jgi:hypothetical protein
MKRCMVLMVVVAACGGDGDGGGGDGNAKEVAAADFPEQVATVLCEAFAECAKPLFDAFLAGDCVTELTRDFEDDMGDLERLIADDRVAYDGVQGAACVDALRAAGCDALRGDSLAVCDDALDGTVAAGGACNSDAECQGDSYCKQEAQCPGTCSALVAVGDDCLDSVCVDGAFCDDEATCQPAPGAGQACDELAAQCEFGQLCVGDNAMTGVSGTCKTIDAVFAGDEGEACDPEADQLCKEGLSCAVLALDMQSGVTFACTKPVASRTACKLAVPQQCPRDEYCDVGTDVGSFEGSCRALPQADQPCAANQLCGAGLTCIGNGDATVCKPLARVGASCTQDAACHSGLCRAGKCAAGLGCAP